MRASSYSPVYTVTQGCAQLAHYGVMIARGGGSTLLQNTAHHPSDLLTFAVGLPDDVVQEATRLLAVIEEKGALF